MRLQVGYLVSVVAFLVIPRTAFAEGDDGGMDAATLDASGVCQDGLACADAAAEAASPLVVACDGDLCDTLQGRPSCALAAGSAGSRSSDMSWLVGVAAASVLTLSRRTRRGA
jgi:hypothetical protein